ncbi:MAG TPA: hypothetical protein PKC55_08515 [Dysgonomonas sp.]|uniref:hypothetical protein n=1 Tax=unclassified Dysgonomonas TaxID=2630389 RepID=UPI0024BD4E73|nr:MULTISPECIES: hypothetical protein [unclassified Dysgonomonas]MBS5979789.1 hypothetical protein [Dysgonomonas mossii]HML64854.1 hypothetical protein [Dysgonomonas sp.]
MKHKQTSLRWITLYLLLFIIMSACSSDHEVYGDEPKTVEPLTVVEAKGLYEQYIGNTARLKSQRENGEEIILSPEWDSGLLFSDSTWSVVEFSFDGKGRKTIYFMTEETMESVIDKDDISAVRNVLRLVVMRNHVTGENYIFNMVVIPELNYMKKRGDFDECRYLQGLYDLDGTVLYFNADGDFVNGWIYRNGRIVESILQGRDFSGQKTKSSTCYTYVRATSDGGYEVEIVCGRKPIDNETVEDDMGGGGLGPVDIGNPSVGPINTGGGGSSGTGTSTSGKNPEKRTDCTDKASQNSQKAQGALGNIAVKSQIESLRINAKTNSATEYGVGISYDPGFGTYSITGGKVWQGTPGTNNTGIGASRYTVFTAHTHYTGLNAAPSCGDVIATVGFYKSAREQGGSYKGTVTFAADGKEYMIYVNDPSALERFYNGFTNNDFYERGGKNGDEFKNESEWAKAYKVAKEYMEDKGYSQNDAQSYALSHILDQYNTGLKISSRQGAIGEFKEQKTDTQGTGKNTKYTPKICP